MAVVIEALDSGGHRVSMQKFAADDVLVGRAYDCDYTVADPHVDPRHLRIHRPAGIPGASYRVTDEHTVNGTRIGRVLVRGESATIAPGEVLVIGRTRLRISDPSGEVAPALTLTGLDRFADWAGKSAVCIAALAGTGLVAALGAFQRSDASFKFSQLLDNLVAVFSVVIVVAGFWALIGRIGRRKANIRAHATIAGGVWMIAALWALLQDATLFNFNWSGAGNWAGPVSAGLITALGQYVHLSLATNLGATTRCGIAALIFAVTPGLSLYKSLERSEEFRSRVQHPVTLFPPGWHLGREIDSDTFVRKSEKSFRLADAEADKKAQAESPDTGAAEERPRHTDDPTDDSPVR